MLTISYECIITKWKHGMIYKSDLTNVFCYHYMAYLANFRTKNRGFLVLFFRTVPDNKNG